MKKLVMLFVVILMVVLLVGCNDVEPTPTPVEVDLDVQEILEVLEAQDYELVLVMERREVTGGYEYGLKFSNQSTYNYNPSVWYFSKQNIKTAGFALLIHVTETNYLLVDPNK